MYKKLKAFIGVALIALPLFITPVGLFLSPHGNSGPVLAVQPTVAFANDADCGTGVFGGSILACIPGAYKVMIFWPSYLIIKGAGIFFDFFMNWSISSHTFSNSSDLVTRGWAAVRDIANIFFIFVLLYIAIGTILNLSQVKTKKMLVKVIIVALLINFSLFFTKIIIDASNILAGAFAGSIELEITNQNNVPVEPVNGPQYSVGIVSIFNPQALLGTESGSMLDELYNNSNTFEAAGTEVAFILIVSAVLLAMSFVFVLVAFLLLGRVIELWYLMIISPIAFISIILPFNIPQFGWSEWFKKLISAAFLAPVFMFFMYLIIIFLNLGLSSITFDPSGSFWNPLLQMVIPFVIVLVLILKAKTIAVKMSGEVGAAFAKVGGAVAGLGVAALSGGASLALQSTVGRAGAGMAKSTRSGFAGRMQRSMGNKIQGGSMDWRKTSSGQSIMKGMGMSSTANKFQPSGGYKGNKQRYENTRTKDAEQRTANAATKERKDLEPLQDEMDRFTAVFGEEVTALEKTVAAARSAAKDNNDPDLQGGLDTDLANAKADLATKTGTVQPGFSASSDTLSANITAQKKVIATKTNTTRDEAAQDVKDEWFTFRSKGTRDSLSRKIRRGHKTEAEDTK